MIYHKNRLGSELIVVHNDIVQSAVKTSSDRNR